MSAQHPPRRGIYTDVHRHWFPEEWASIVAAARLGGDRAQPRAARLAEAQYLRSCAEYAMRSRAAIVKATGSEQS